MTPDQKEAISIIIDESYERGFISHPLRIIAERMYVERKELYNPEAKTGLLWDFDARSGSQYAGWLAFANGSVRIMAGCLEQLKEESEYGGY